MFYYSPVRVIIIFLVRRGLITLGVSVRGHLLESVSTHHALIKDSALNSTNDERNSSQKMGQRAEKSIGIY